jgi:hypothetical protein
LKNPSLTLNATSSYTIATMAKAIVKGLVQSMAPFAAYDYQPTPSGEYSPAHLRIHL